MRNLTTQLLLRERITTSTAKAKELRKFVEPIITKAKKGTPHAYNSVKSKVFLHHLVLPHLFGVLGQRYQNRAGGYCRLSRLGLNHRSEDECVVELVDHPNEFTKHYRTEALKRYKDQLYRVETPKAQEPYSFVYPFQKKIAMLKDKTADTSSLKSTIIQKLKDIIEKHIKKLQSPPIEYFSNVSLTSKGPIYSGEKLNAPPALMANKRLVKTKVVFHEKIVPSESLRLRKELSRRYAKIGDSPSKAELADKAIRKEAMKLGERLRIKNEINLLKEKGVLEQSTEYAVAEKEAIKSLQKKNLEDEAYKEDLEILKELKGLKEYNVKISTVERVELVADQENALTEKDSKEFFVDEKPKLTLGRHGRNKHLR